MRQASKSREEWKELVNNFTVSGEKQKDYCQQRGIGYNAFKFWYYKLRDENNGTTATIDKADFVNLKIIASSQEGLNNVVKASKAEEMMVVKIILVNGIKLEITTSNILQLIHQLNYVA